MCPFCFYVDKLVYFRMKNRSGEFSRKRYVCPECRQIMLRDTLMMELSLEQLAYWIYAHIRVFNRQGEKFYDRLSMGMIAKRVKERGWGNEFWDAWKEAKTFSMERLTAIVENSYKVGLVQSRLVN